MTIQLEKITMTKLMKIINSFEKKNKINKSKDAYNSSKSNNKTFTIKYNN